MSGEESLESDWSKFQRKLKNKKTEKSIRNENKSDPFLTSKSSQKPQSPKSDNSSDSDINRLRDELLDSSYNKDVQMKKNRSDERKVEQHSQSSSSRSYRADDKRSRRSRSQEKRDKSDHHSRRSHSKSPKRSEERKSRRSKSPSSGDRHRKSSDSSRTRRDDREYRKRHYDDRHRDDSPPNSDRPKGGKVTREMMVDAILKGKNMESLEGLEGSSEMITSNEKHSDLPLNNPMESRFKGGKRRIAEMSEKAQRLTGVALPKYYNQAAVNPLKYAEQIQKRKLLWQGAKEKEVSSSWQQLLAAAGDDKNAEKFKKLVGFRQQSGTDSAKSQEEIAAKQKELMKNLDIQYEIARMSTHTHRGVGLGFASQQFSQPSTSTFTTDKTGTD